MPPVLSSLPQPQPDAPAFIDGSAPSARFGSFSLSVVGKHQDINVDDA
jgi:hypothetical protein